MTPAPQGTRLLRRSRRLRCRRRPTRSSPSSTPPSIVSRPASTNWNWATWGRRRSNSTGRSEVLLESPYGARSEPRIREHFDRLVDRISAYEITALTEGDGFSEKPSEPATIDELLALSLFDKPAPTPELTQAVKSDLESTSHDVPIPLNARVLSYIELFQGRLRTFITEGLARGSKYLPMIQNVFRAEGLPLDLAYVPLVESAFKPNALSRAKARGVWQFMRGTALENGLRHDWYIDERSDPEKATLAAAKYLKTLNGACSAATGIWRWRRTTAARDGCSGRCSGPASRSSGRSPRRPGICPARRASTCR